MKVTPPHTILFNLISQLQSLILTLGEGQRVHIWLRASDSVPRRLTVESVESDELSRPIMSYDFTDWNNRPLVREKETCVCVCVNIATLLINTTTIFPALAAICI